MLWAKKVGYVPQSLFFDDTVCRNIAFGVPKEEIDNSRIQEVLEESAVKGYGRSSA